MNVITRDDVVWTVHADWESTAVRGNALASGDPALDREAEEEILDRWDRGDAWAWCCVEVRGTYRGLLVASEYLGCCSYKDEREFRADGYYDDMRDTVVGALNKQLEMLNKE